MARRKKGDAGGIAVVLIGAAVVAIAAIPKEVWIAIGVIAAIALAAWLYSAFTKSKSEPAGEAPSTQIVVRFNTQVQGRTSAPAQQQPKGRAVPPRWIPVGETIEVAGTEISGGLLYFGSGLRGADGEIDPALIDPRLAVARSPVDVRLRHQMDYWPSYSTISPQARRAYLDWLGTGRRNQEADIGYVFLFFYGLERRALLDAASDPIAEADREHIENEVRRLLDIYGGSRSFRGYATAFLEYLFVQRATGELHEGDPPRTSGRDMSLALRISLGRMAVSGRPLPPQWALAWMQSDSRVSLPRALQRCPVEFHKLFVDRYLAHFGDGIKLPVNRTKLRLAYRPASSGFARQELPLAVGDIPDVMAVVAPIKKIEMIVEECAAALAPYSRFLGKYPDAGGSLEGVLLLPQALWPSPAQSTMQALNERVGEGMRVMTLGDLISSLGGAGTLTRDRCRSLAHALEEIQIGIEPDILAGARTPKVEDRVILFRAELEDSALRAAPVYQAASITLDLACSVALADGQASANELHLLMRQIDGWAHLTGGQRKRLRARLRMAIDSRPSLSSLRKKLDVVPAEGRRALAHLLSTLAQADGTVSPAEVKLLEKIYKALGVDTQVASSDLHAAAASSVDEPPSLSQQASAVYSAAGFTLDVNRIKALQKETEEVSALLSRVFVAEAPVPVEEEEEREETRGIVEPGLLGLDPEHAVFLRLLITRSSWSRQELADAAADMELMLDGALERINDAAFEQFDEPLIEGDDPIEVARDVLENLTT